MRDANTLNRQALEGSQAATCVGSAGSAALYPILVTPGNSGRVFAKDASANIAISRRDLKTGKNIGAVHWFTLGGPDRTIRAGDPIQQSYTIDSFTPAKLSNIKQAKETFVVKIFATCDDGFGYIIKQPSCSMYIPFNGGGWADCLSARVEIDKCLPQIQKEGLNNPHCDE